MDIRYVDEDLVVCIKPAGVLSTDEEGGLPGLLRSELGGEIRTVHRLDRVVSGLMVLARNRESAARLSRLMEEQTFHKAYLAVVHGCPAEPEGRLRDLLWRDKRRRMTFVADAPGKGVQEAALDYRVLGRDGDHSLLRIVLHTGRTHQIRVQFASRGMPLVGERKYSEDGEGTPLSLFSAELSFLHPRTYANLRFAALPPSAEPWDRFVDSLKG